MGLAEQEAAAQRLEPEIAEACGMLNVATARLVGLVAQVIDTEAWQVAGIHSVEQYSFADQRAVLPDEPPAEEPRRVSFGRDDSGVWRLSAVLPADEGAVVEKASTEARDGHFRAHECEAGTHPSPDDVSWADALVAMAEQSLAAEAVARPHRVPPPGHAAPRHRRAGQRASRPRRARGAAPLLELRQPGQGPLRGGGAADARARLATPRASQITSICA